MNVKIALAVLGAALLAPSAIAQSLGTAKTCTFYEHFDYRGESFSLHDGHVLTVDPAFVVGNDWLRGPDYQRFNAPQWAGRVSSNKVANGCRAIVVNDWQTNVWVQDVPRYSATYNDKAATFGCRCQ